MVSISCIWLMTWQSGTIEEAGNGINWMGLLLGWESYLGSIPCLANNMVGGPYR